MIKGDSSYFNMLGIRVKQDNHNPNNYWLNEYAFGQLGIDERATEFRLLTQDGVETMSIGGIYYDFKIFPLLEREGYTLPEDADFHHPAVIRNTLETFSFLTRQEVEARFAALQVPYSQLKCETVNLEDAFIDLTGKY